MSTHAIGSKSKRAPKGRTLKEPRISMGFLLTVGAFIVGMLLGDLLDLFFY